MNAIRFAITALAIAGAVYWTPPAAAAKRTLAPSPASSSMVTDPASTSPTSPTPIVVTDPSGAFTTPTLIVVTDPSSAFTTPTLIVVTDPSSAFPTPPGSKPTGDTLPVTGRQTGVVLVLGLTCVAAGAFLISFSRNSQAGRRH